MKNSRCRNRAVIGSRPVARLILASFSLFPSVASEAETTRLPAIMARSLVAAFSIFCSSNVAKGADR